MTSCNAYKKYTEHEDSMLEEWISEGKHYSYMARKLGRSIESVTRRIERLGIGDRHLMTGMFTAADLARIVGYNPTTICNVWIKEQGLPAEKKAFIGEVKPSTRYFIKAQDFWTWVELRKDSIQFSDIERGTLLPEPDWLQEELRKEYYQSKRRKFWTEKEDELLLKMFYENEMTQVDIAKEFGVTRASIQKRIARIRSQKRG